MEHLSKAQRRQRTSSRLREAQGPLSGTKLQFRGLQHSWTRRAGTTRHWPLCAPATHDGPLLAPATHDGPLLFRIVHNSFPLNFVHGSLFQ